MPKPDRGSEGLARREFLARTGAIGVGLAASGLLASGVRPSSALAATGETWPTLPGFSPNNFVDHFEGASLDVSKWTAVTSGTGSVVLEDSNAVIDTGAANQAAFIYRNVRLDPAKSQLWMICLRIDGSWTADGQTGHFVQVLSGGAAPAATTKPSLDARTVIERTLAGQGPVRNLDCYFNGSGTKLFWDGSNSQWTSSYSSSMTSVRAQPDDYYVFGIEFDGVNARWRVMTWGQAFAAPGTWTFDQGWRLFALSDWVNWSNTRSSANLWLTIGHTYIDTPEAVRCQVEWVRYAEAPQGNVVIDGWMCGLASSFASGPRIRHVYSYDGDIFIPQDRTSWALDLGTGSLDNNGLTAPCAVFDGVNTDWLFYRGIDDNVNSFICVASAPHNNARTGQNTVGWTRSGSNPLISQGTSGATDARQINFMQVVMDLSEVDSSKRWKMLYGGQDASGIWRAHYATAPAAQGPWAKHGVVIDVGAAGANDSTWVQPSVIVRFSGMWYVFYEGHDSNSRGHLMYATGTDLGALTKSGTLYTPNNVSQPLTANLTTASGRTVVVGSTSGYRKDAAVVLSQSQASDTYSTSRIRKIVDATHLELYHGLTGFTTTVPAARIRQITSSPNLTSRVIALGADGAWRFYCVFWEPFDNTPESAHHKATPLEEMYLLKHSAVAPNGARPVVQDLPYVTSRGFNGDQESFENLTLLNSPFAGP